MLSKNKFLLASILAGTLAATTAQAAVIMDATTNNGSFEDVSYGYWSNATPAGWEPSINKNHLFNVYGIPMAYWDSVGINNTGVLVTVNTQYTVSALMDANDGLTANIWINATENADGTGNVVELSHISFTGNNPSSTGGVYSPRTNTNFMTAVGPTTGAATDASVDGYYVQVKFGTTTFGNYLYSWYDNIEVTSSAAVPEPATLGLLLPAAALFADRRRRSRA